MQTETTAPHAPPKTGAERVAKHRRRKRRTELQALFGIAKLVNGKGLGDQRGALLTLLEKAAEDTNIPDDITAALDDAIDKLRSSGLAR